VRVDLHVEGDAVTTRIFKRNWNITIGDVVVNDLACDFEAKKSLQVVPNTCVLHVKNLAPATRKKLTDPRAIPVRIEAGYGTSLDQIYLGDVRALAPGSKDGADVITELSSGDGEHPMAVLRVGVPVGAKTAPATALRAIARALASSTPGATAIGLGNVDQVAATLASTGSATFPRATVLHGNAARALTDFCRSAGLEWSIQDGVIQVLDLGQPLVSHPYLLNSDTGLYGSPKLDTDGRVTFECAMLPSLRPGMRVELDSKFVSGIYRVSQATYKGETWAESPSSPWGMECVCDKPGVVL
jgi:hypothetical protein